MPPPSLFSSPFATSTPPPPPPLPKPNSSAPPWLHGPQLLPRNPDALKPQSPNPKPRTPNPKSRTPKPPALTAGVPGGRTRRAVLGIIRRVRSLELTDPPNPNPDPSHDRYPFHLSLQEPDQSQEGHGTLNLESKKWPKAAPWAAARDEEAKWVFRREKKAKEATKAEAAMEAKELARLRKAAKSAARRWVRAKKAGVTDEVVEGVKEAWKASELAAVKIVEPLRRNMDRAREIVETKTGGLIVWSNRDTLVVYRGHSNPIIPERTEDSYRSLANSNFRMAQGNEVIFWEESSGTESELRTSKNGEAENFQGNGNGLDMGLQKDDEIVSGTLYEREVNRLLDSLGPRFIDWWWQTPLPVDADLLPEIVPDFRTPFRQCPPGVRLKLTDDELTYLRKLAHPLPTHFALGRNTKLQGLAAAILKLWEKSLIAKIAVKVGIQNTNNAQMSWELKRLTGGTLILRNKYFIILYRGKDFLPRTVVDSVIERQTHLDVQQLKEEEARSEVVKSVRGIERLSSETSSVGTFREYQDIQVNHTKQNTQFCETKVQLEAEKVRLEKELKEHERKLCILMKKIEKSDKLLANLHSAWSPSEQSADQELLTEEERETFRKIGLKMDEHMLLGRRGVYDGVIEDIRQHWKHREVVKVITKQKQTNQLTYTSKLLEIETGGTLIAVEKLTSSHAIILYRGKNYHRSIKQLPNNLLTKREASQRSIEVQRRGSLKHFARQGQQSIRELKQRLGAVVEQIRELCS